MTKMEQFFKEGWGKRPTPTPLRELHKQEFELERKLTNLRALIEQTGRWEEAHRVFSEIQERFGGAM